MSDVLSQISAMVYRSLLWASRSPFRLADVFLWPFVALFTLVFFLSVVGGETELIGLLILAVIGWKAMFFVTFEMTAAFIEEYWDRSLPNLLVSPINTLWISVGGAITGVLKTIAVTILVLTVGFFIYGFTIIGTLTFAIALFFIILAAFSVGFSLFGLACYYDKRNIFTLSFVLPEIISLISGPYYNVKDVFPEWLVAIVNTFPTTHAFNLIKSIFGFGEANYVMLIVTTIVWLIIAFTINKTFYNLGRKRGTLTKVG